MKKLLLVVGTRPNYIKITQFKNVAASKFPDVFDIKTVHTGQHFDPSMADVFFKQLDIWPDYFLNISQASPNTQMGEIMIRMEEIVEIFQPDCILVPGDVNSTLAAALSAHKLGITLGHLESGLRSFDRTMPEEINRILTDEISDLFFVTEQSGIDNLLKEGKSMENIHFVGNTMIDTLVAFEQQIDSQKSLPEFDIQPNEFILMTIHRPATVDNENGLKSLISLLKAITERHKVLFPIHPRTRKNLNNCGFEQEIDSMPNLILTEPMDYFNFQNLIKNCKMVVTDSGGIQEETTFQKKPCLTLRPNTERPSTIEIGTNTLLNFEQENILKHIESVFEGNYKQGEIPKFWDGKATERILQILITI